jgi:hypothetical protein
MAQKSGAERLAAACRKGTSFRLLEKYIQYCQSVREAEGTPEPSTKRGVKQRSGRVPNLAGFCRYLGIGTEKFRLVTEDYPDEVQRILAILEDEALNSVLPPAVLSAYLKRRLGYEREEEPISSEPLQICFEHDILGDGE